MKELASFAASTLCALALVALHAPLALAEGMHDHDHDHDQGHDHDHGPPNSGPHDPGARAGSAGAGAPLAGLDSYEASYFLAAQALFITPEGIGDGLGPRFNLDSCAGCHAQPSVGGSSPAVNPQIAIATAYGARNSVPQFISANGPVREARFKMHPDGTPDGGVHDLYVVSGRVDFNGNAASCTITQDDFAGNLARNNLSMRIPTPTYGNGLMEAIPASALSANLASYATQKNQLGIVGRFNHSGNTGTITRFGWKAQNASALMFAGEAYNVEMGITNELFPTERDETQGCATATTPNSYTLMSASAGVNTLSSMEMVGIFVRFLAPPAPSAATPGGAASITHGRQLFASTGCALCHAPSFATGDNTVVALRNQNVNLYSDLALHQMGPQLADDIQQGEAAGDEFRTAPLWGLGQRLFFMHDGRTNDLAQAIELHASRGNSKYAASEANAVIGLYHGLNSNDAQDLLNFLRSL
ncbi:MAG TPA: di-heme oxidoredictase family protein [Steroidobacteraceae bacterium]